MRVYFITKKMLLTLFLVIIISVTILAVIPYTEVISNVFNADKEIPIYSVDTNENKISITFDCAWGGDDIPQIIDILKQYDAKATFFVVGEWLDKYPDNIKLLSKEGHEIANHSDKHLDMTKLSQDKILADINSANKKIEDLIGKKNILFRAPYGAYNNNVVKTVKSINNYTIQWDVDSLDWKELGVEPMVSRVESKVKNGSILLFHNDTKYTVMALPTILGKLKEKGYKFVTVSELIHKDNYYIDHKGMQHSLIKETDSID